MFGGQDNNASAPTGGGAKDDTLTGVDDLAASLNATAASSATAPSDDNGTTAAAAPSEPAETAGAPAPQEEDTATGTSDNTDTPAADNDDLLNLKQQALQQLTPIVGQLDQTPEEKFRTTMMLIQASDNQSLLKDAYEAANAIEDEKVKAQALLDVVNEINYFTQPKQ